MATVLHYALLLALVELAGVPAAPAAFVGALFGAVTAYTLNRFITFTSSSASHQHAVPRFMLIAAGGAALNGVMVWSGVHWLGWHYLAAQGMASLLVLGLTYRLNQTWTFAR